MNPVHLNDVAYIQEMRPSARVKDCTLPSVMLLCSMRVAQSQQRSKSDLQKDHVFTTQHYVVDDKDAFINAFHFTVRKYEDIDIWRPQNIRTNRILLTSATTQKETKYYLIYISTLPLLHDHLVHESIQQNQTIHQYAQSYLTYEKDILLRNARRKLYSYCCEHYLQPMSQSMDTKVFKIKDRYVSCADLTHFEYMNDLIHVHDSIYYLHNCTYHDGTSIGHIKLYTSMKTHFLLDTVDTKTTGIYTNIYDIMTSSLSNYRYATIIKTHPHILYDMQGKPISTSLKDIFKTTVVLHTIRQYPSTCTIFNENILT